MLPVKIAGLGAYLPERRVTNAELESRLGLPPDWIATRTGVRERRCAADETASGMAARAVRAALADAGKEVREVDLIIGASSGPQQLIPCTAALVQRELGAPDGGSACFDMNATCLSFPVALHHAALFVASGIYRNVAVFSTEIASRSLNPCEPECFALFGDGAAAAVITRTPQGEPCAVWGARFATHSSGADHTHFLGAGSLHHPNDPATTGAMNQFHMDGPAVFRQATRLLPRFLDDFLRDVGWRRGEIDAVVPHQASGRALDLLSSRLGLCDEQVVRNIAIRGNCVAASLPLALAESVAAGRIRRGHRVLLLGTGAGLTLGALALTF